MNSATFLSRRNWLRAGAVIGSAQLLGVKPPLAKTILAKTPALTAEEIAAIETAMSKKGAYNEGQAVHTTHFRATI